MKKNYKVVIIILLLLLIFVGYKYLSLNKKNLSYEEIEKEFIKIEEIEKNIKHIKLSEENKEEFNNEKNHGYTLSTTTLKIDYPIFIQNYNDKILKKIINKLNIKINGGNKNPYDSNLYKVLYIKNISGNDFKFLKDITSKIFFKEYNLNFTNYNDKNYRLFEGINYSEKIHDFSIDFNGVLEGEITLEKTLNILSSENRSYNYFSISTDKEFNKLYKISKNELDIFHKINSYGLYAEFDIGSDISDEYLIKSFNKTNIGEYSLGKFSKGEGPDDKLEIKD